MTATTDFTIRSARDADADALDRLAQLDSQRPLSGPVLLAEVAGRAIAALGLADGRATADPFLPSAPVVELLRARAQQITARPPGSVAGREHARLFSADAAATGGHP
jgi:hypothetical protein